MIGKVHVRYVSDQLNQQALVSLLFVSLIEYKVAMHVGKALKINVTSETPRLRRGWSSISLNFNRTLIKHHPAPSPPIHKL